MTRTKGGGGAPPKIDSIGQPRIRGRIGQPCPRCGSGPGHRCVQMTHGPNSRPTLTPRADFHHERRATAVDVADAALAPAVAAFNRDGGVSIADRGGR